MNDQALVTAICAGCLVPILLFAGLISGIRVRGALMQLMYSDLGIDLWGVPDP
jgi:hypothetical protein